MNEFSILGAIIFATVVAIGLIIWDHVRDSRAQKEFREMEEEIFNAQDESDCAGR